MQTRRNHFYALDYAAEALFETAGFASATLREDLMRRLRDRHGFTLTTDPSLLVEGTFWRIDRRAKIWCSPKALRQKANFSGWDTCLRRSSSAV